MKRVNFSNLLRVLYFAAAVCIVAIHANSIFVIPHPAAWNVTLHHAVCGMLTGWAVPFFFVCSGFFFARGRYVRDGGYGAFLRGKVKTIAIPYFAWCLIAAAISLPLVVTNNFMTHRAFLERTFLASENIVHGMGLLFGIGVFGGPCHNGPLWFLRSLMILFLFAPLWRLLARHWFGLLSLIGLFVVVHMGCIPAAIYGYDWEYFFIGIVLSGLLPKTILERRDGQHLSHVPKFVGYSFWLYCTHNIILGWILAGGHFLLGKSDVSIAVLTVSAIPTTILVSLLLASCVQKTWPRTFTVLNGGRALTYYERIYDDNGNVVSGNNSVPHKSRMA